jgi:uncharacterized protein (DUF983 family)
MYGGRASTASGVRSKHLNRAEAKKGRVAAMSALTLSSLTSLFLAAPRDDRGAEVTSLRAVMRGLRGRCPNCGRGHMFSRFLKVADHCAVCGEELFHQRADDFPAYLVIVLVGHTVVPLALLVETEFAPALWLQVALWVPLTGLLSLALLQPIKGAVVAMQWFGGMHGFARAYAKRHGVPACAQVVARRSPD